MAEVAAAWHIHGPDPRHHLIVVGHLLFDLKITRCPQTFNDEIRLYLSGSLDG
jgi:hypothetical protein